MDWKVLELLNVLDEGAYGVVLAVKHRVTGELYAVKAGKHASADPRVMYQTLREIKILRSISSHPNVARLADAFRSEEEHIYLVFERAHCGLHKELERLPGRALPAATLRLVAWQLLQGLAHCHDHQVVHRDVKPANVLLSRAIAPVASYPKSCSMTIGSASDGVDAAVQTAVQFAVEGAGGGGGGSAPAAVAPLVKLCDFGFARHVYCSEPWYGERYSSYVVTRYYRAPEVLVGCKYGTSVDIWSYGCTLAELATGQPLFPGTSTLDQLDLITRCLGPLPTAQTESLAGHLQLGPRAANVIAPPPSARGKPLQALLPGLDPELYDLIAACLALEPRRRPSARRLLQMPYFDAVPQMLAGTDLAYLLSPSPAAATPCTTATACRLQAAKSSPPPRALSSKSVTYAAAGDAAGEGTSDDRPAPTVDGRARRVSRTIGYLPCGGYVCPSARSPSTEQAAAALAGGSAVSGAEGPACDGNKPAEEPGRISDVSVTCVEAGGGGDIVSGVLPAAADGTLVPYTTSTQHSSGLDGGGAEATAAGGDGSVSDSVPPAGDASVVNVLSPGGAAAAESSSEPRRPTCASDGSGSTSVAPSGADSAAGTGSSSSGSTSGEASSGSESSARGSAAEVADAVCAAVAAEADDPPGSDCVRDAVCLRSNVSSVEPPCASLPPPPVPPSLPHPSNSASTGPKGLADEGGATAAAAAEAAVQTATVNATVPAVATKKAAAAAAKPPRPLPPSSSLGHMHTSPAPLAAACSNTAGGHPKGDNVRQRLYSRSSFLSNARSLISRQPPTASRTCSNIPLPPAAFAAAQRPSAQCLPAVVTGSGGGSGDGGVGSGVANVSRHPSARISASMAEVRLLPSITGGAAGGIAGGGGGSGFLASTSLTACTTRWSTAGWLSSDDGYGGGGGCSSGMRPYMWSSVSRNGGAAGDSFGRTSGTIGPRGSMEKDRERVTTGGFGDSGRYRDKLGTEARPSVRVFSSVFDDGTGSVGSGGGAGDTVGMRWQPLPPLPPSLPSLSAAGNEHTVMPRKAKAAANNKGAVAVGRRADGGGAPAWWVRILRSAGLSCALPLPPHAIAASPASSPPAAAAAAVTPPATAPMWTAEQV